MTSLSSQDGKKRSHIYLTPETNIHTHTCPITTTNNSNNDNIRKMDLRKQKTMIFEIWEINALSLTIDTAYCSEKVSVAEKRGLRTALQLLTGGNGTESQERPGR